MSEVQRLVSDMGRLFLSAMKTYENQQKSLGDLNGQGQTDDKVEDYRSQALNGAFSLNPVALMARP